MSDSVEKLLEALREQIDWVKRTELMLKRAELTVEPKFLDGVTRSVKTQTAVAKSTYINLQEFEKKP